MNDQEHFVTLFDRNFLPQGLALHESLLRHEPGAVLWVLCMDDQVASFLDSLDDPSLRTIALSDIETDELRELRRTRTRAEYCWTVTPRTPALVFERDPSVRRVTYVDADLWLLRSPRPVLDAFEASGASVLITEHAYAPEHDRSASSGRFCVQFMTFVRGHSEAIRAWWQARCDEWCFARHEDGRFGDQKYLDDWPERFAGEVHVASPAGAFLAPWNASRFPYGEAVAWHFHSLRLLPDRRVLLYEGYRVPEAARRDVYGPYIAALGRQLDRIGEPIVQRRETPIQSSARWLLQTTATVLGPLTTLVSRAGRVEKL